VACAQGGPERRWGGGSTFGDLNEPVLAHGRAVAQNETRDVLEKERKKGKKETDKAKEKEKRSEREMRDGQGNKKEGIAYGTRDDEALELPVVGEHAPGQVDALEVGRRLSTTASQDR